MPLSLIGSAKILSSVNSTNVSSGAAQLVGRWLTFYLPSVTFLRGNGEMKSFRFAILVAVNFGLNASVNAAEHALFPGEVVSIDGDQVSCVGRATPRDYASLSDIALLSFTQFQRCLPFHKFDATHHFHSYKLFKYRGVFDGRSERDREYVRAHLDLVTQSNPFRNQSEAAKQVAPILRELLISGSCDQ